MSSKLSVYNSLTKQKEEFQSIEPGRVRFYLCGPTVYDLLHVGNFRGILVFSAFRKWLEMSGYKVDFVYNFTDVDDKIIERAKSTGQTPKELSEHFIEEFKRDAKALGLVDLGQNPKVSEHIPEIVKMIEELVRKEKAYVAESGEVFYDISKFEGYGKLSGRSVDDLRAGVRIEVGELKKNPLDFTLWKPSKPGEMGWPSPWCEMGRPGWHIECSAMSWALLGEELDIHSGGMDLQFPHHENEIAQSEGCHHKTYARYWMHNNMIQFGSQKMSKSVGNVVKARDYMERFHPEVFRYLLHSVHYRSVLDLSDQQSYQAITALSRVYKAKAGLEKWAQAQENGLGTPEAEAGQLTNSLPMDGPIGVALGIATLDPRFCEALNDDFHAPKAFALLFEKIREFNSFMSQTTALRGGEHTRLDSKPSVEGAQVAEELSNLLKLFQHLFGLFGLSNWQEIRNQIWQRELNLDSAKLDQLIEERVEARRQKNYKRSDEIRDELNALGLEILDTPDGCEWTVRHKKQ